VRAEITDGGSADQDSFGPQQAALEFEVPAVATEFAGRCDDAMTWNVALPAVAHDVSHRARRSGSSGCLGDVAVRGNLADGDPADYGDHPRREWGHKR